MHCNYPASMTCRLDCASTFGYSTAKPASSGGEGNADLASEWGRVHRAAVLESMLPSANSGTAAEAACSWVVAGAGDPALSIKKNSSGCSAASAAHPAAQVLKAPVMPMAKRVSAKVKHQLIWLGGRNWCHD
jgi:hypothetical protein